MTPADPLARQKARAVLKALFGYMQPKDVVEYETDVDTITLAMEGRPYD